jgi:peptidoglycan/LPS O-acetylase OafA/YrhL
MPALDGLRALAVIAVLLYHADVGWARGGYFGVDAFFVLSGFLITSLLLGEWQATGSIDLKAFWIRRARRLLPAMALVLAGVAVYAAFAANPLELNQLRRDGLSTLVYAANWNQVVSHQSYFEQFAAPSALRHTWSLAIEEQFYLLWPLAIFALLRRRISRPALFAGCGVLALGSAVLMGALYRPGHDPSRVYYGTDTRAQSLLIGAMLAILFAGREQSVHTHRRVLHGGAIAAACALAYIWTTTSESDGWQFRGGFALAAVLVAVVIAGVTLPNDTGLLGKLLSSAPLRAIGIISYGLYLWHWPIYVYLSESRTGLDRTPLLLARLGVTFAVATVSFLLVERPVRHGSFPIRRRTVRVAVPVLAAALVGGLVASTAGAVPVELRPISAAQIAASRPPPPPRPAAGGSEPVAAEAAARPMRIMLVGDSMSASVAPGLQREADARHFRFWNVAVPGCGLASDVGEHWDGESWLPIDERCLPSWRERWPRQLAQYQPEVVVMLVGAHDTFDRRINGSVVEFDTSAGERLATRDLHDAVTMLSKGGAHVVVLTAPYFVMGWPMRIDTERSNLYKPWIDRYNSLQRAVVQRSSGRASVLDLNTFIDPDGVWTDTVNGVKVRTVDRMHLSAEGSHYVAEWIVSQLGLPNQRDVRK